MRLKQKIMWVPRRAASIRLASHRRSISDTLWKSVRKLCSRLQIHASLRGESRRASKRSASTWRTRFRTVSPKNGRNYPDRGHLSPAIMLQIALSASKGCVQAWINPVTDPLVCLPRTWYTWPSDSKGAMALGPTEAKWHWGQVALGPWHWGRDTRDWGRCMTKDWKRHGQGTGARWILKMKIFKIYKKWWISPKSLSEPLSWEIILYFIEYFEYFVFFLISKKTKYSKTYLIQTYFEYVDSLDFKKKKTSKK